MTTKSRIVIAVLLACVVLAAGAVLLARRGSSLTAEGHLAKAAEFAKAGDPLRAHQHRMDAAKLAPQDARVQYEAARSALRLGARIEALDMAEKAWDLGKKDHETLQVLVESSSRPREERFDAALKRVQALTESPEQRKMLAGLLVAADKPKEAVPVLERLQAEAPSGENARMLAHALLATGEPAKAAALIDQRRAAQKAEAEDYEMLVPLLFLQDRVDDAKAAYAEAEARTLVSPALRLLHGQSLFLSGEADQAAATLQPLAGGGQDDIIAHGARLWLLVIALGKRDVAAVAALAPRAEGARRWLEGERACLAAVQGILAGKPDAGAAMNARQLLGDSVPAFLIAARTAGRAGDRDRAIRLYEDLGRFAPLAARSPGVLLETAVLLAEGGQDAAARRKLDELHGRGLSSRQSAELARDLAARSKDWGAAAAAQKDLAAGNPDDPAVALAGARLALAAGRADEALATLGTIAAARPADPACAALRGEVLLRLGRREEALAAMQAAVAAGAPGLRVALARLLLDCGKTEAAAKECEAALAVRPDDGEARYAMAMVRMRQNRNPEAREMALLADKAGIPGSRHLLNMLDLAAGNPLAARDAAAKDLADDPMNSRARLLLAQCENALGNFAKADTLLSGLPADDDAVRRQRLSSAFGLGRLAEARTLAEDLLRRAPKDPDLLRMRLDILLREKKTAEARQALDALAAVAPPAEPPRWEARLRYAGGDEAGALAALAAKLDDPATAFLWAELKLLRKEDDGIIPLLRRHKAGVQSITRLGSTAARQGMTGASRDLAALALEQGPNDPLLLNNHAWALLQVHPPETAKALDEARRAVAARPDDPAVIDTLAAALLASGDGVECRKELLKKPELLQRERSLAFRMAEALEKSGDRAGALRAYKDCLGMKGAPPVPEDVLRARIETLSK